MLVLVPSELVDLLQNDGFLSLRCHLGDSELCLP